MRLAGWVTIAASAPIVVIASRKPMQPIDHGSPCRVPRRRAIRVVKRQPVPVGTETGNLAEHDWRNDGMVAKLFARMDVGQMDFDGRHADGRQGVAKGNAVMGQRAGIDDDSCRPGTKLLDRVDQRAFMIGLHMHDSQRRIDAACDVRSDSSTISSSVVVP